MKKAKADMLNKTIVADPYLNFMRGLTPKEVETIDRILFGLHAVIANDGQAKSFTDLGKYRNMLLGLIGKIRHEITLPATK